MLPITPRCAGLLLIVCAAIQGAAVDDAERDRAPTHFAEREEVSTHDAVREEPPMSVPMHEDMAVLPDIVLVFGPPSGLGGDCRTGAPCEDFQVCSRDEGLCECQPGYNWALSQPLKQQVCKRCPGLHHGCGEENCCYPHNETTCFNGICQCRYESTECRMETADQFKLATQIALVSAIILVLACLLIILWRTCRKQHGERQRRRLRRRSDASEASLTSVQLRVVERLRNRPPGYHDRTHIRIEKPPSYEETVGQPLRYPALVLDPVHSPLEGPAPGDADAPRGGVDNSAFEDDERGSKPGPTAELHM